MNARRKQQLLYILFDIISSEVVWLSFLLFRWLVYEGRIMGVDSVIIPAFDFYRPLIIYPIACLIIYYLSGFYLRPLGKKQIKVLNSTLISAIIISLGAFFIIIIDDPVDNYHNYLGSLGVLCGLQFILSYLPRMLITLSINKHWSPRQIEVHSTAEAQGIKAGEIDEAIIDIEEGAEKRQLYEIINRLYPLDIEISVKPQVYDMLTGAAQISELESQPLVRITEHHMSDAELCTKRACDVVLSAASLILLSPLYLILALLVYTTSKGSVLYKQERIGLHGVPFKILKFRTMATDAESDTPVLSQDNDPRVTKVGHVLRKYRLDELPQMWNILRGDMSIVGPRPERAYFIQQIEKLAPYYCLVYKIRPGLTSWGPIKVGYTDTLEKMVDRLNYDIVYMENMSIGLDMKILFFTIGVILGGKGK